MNCIRLPHEFGRLSAALMMAATIGCVLGYADPVSVLSVTVNIPIHVPGSTRVHQTAIRELATLFADTDPAALKVLADDAPQPGSLHVALLGESAMAQDLARQGLINLHNVRPDTDAYEVLAHDGVLHLIGNTPRGMIQAVYALQEIIRGGEAPDAALHVSGVFQIRERYFHQRFEGWPGEPADIRYISHLGASHCLLTHDWQGERRHMQAYVPGTVFPGAVDAGTVEQDSGRLRHMVETCLDYGLEPALWITELPCQGGPWVPEEARRHFLNLYPEEVLSDCGTYQGKVLCFSHPKVQEYYREIITRFIEAFPEVSTLFLFGLDSGGEFCDPQACPRCAGMSKFEQRDRLIRFLIDEGSKLRPGWRVLTTGWGWSGDTEQFLMRQKGLPAASGLFLAAETDGWQPERQVHDLLWNARGICRERGQTFLGYDDFHWGDDSVHQLNDIQDYPLGISAKIRRWHTLGVDGVFDHWGGFNQDISCNSVACRAFFMNPLADPERVCRELARKQFGDEAGARAFAAWQSLERAHAILSNACSWAPTQWPGWYPGRECLPTPEGFAKCRIQGGEPPRQAGSITYNPPELSERLQRVGDAWRMAFPHYETAIAHMREAVARADDAPLFYAYWWDGAEKSPTRREHLRRQGLYLESMALAGREIGLHFSLNALYEREQQDPAAYKEYAQALLREDAQACGDAADFFERIQASGDDRMSGRDWAFRYRAKAEGIAQYLK